MNPTSSRFRRFGPYVLLQMTGAGGMGRVDLALTVQGGIERLCALKRQHPDLRTPEHEHRFSREASIAGRLAHESIAQTLGIAEIEGEPCILQEFVHGVNVAQLERRAAAREPLPVELTVHIVKEVARALAFAHAFGGVGIVHRDIAPDNVMLSFAGEVKLIDFGIAKPIGDRSLTSVGSVVGRPIYTAPEVLDGGQADKRADVYSLGVVLWQLLTGQSFPDISVLSMAKAPSASNGAVSSDLNEICLRALEPQPRDRFSSAEELLEAISALPEGESQSRQTLESFLARYFDVSEARRQVGDDIQVARFMLEQVPPPVGPASPPAHFGVPRGPSGTKPSRLRASIRSSDRWILLVAFCGAASVAGVLTWVGRRPVVAGRNFDTPVVVSASRDTAALLREATNLYRTGSLDQAFTLAEKAARGGGGPDAHLLMGKVLIVRQNFETAEDEFRKAAELRPTDPEPRRYLDLIQLRSAATSKKVSTAGNGRRQLHDN